MTTTVQARYLPMVAPFICAGPLRPYLNGVFIEPHAEKGAVLVATDGHRMAVIHDEKAECGAAAIWPLDPYLIGWLSKPSDMMGLIARFDISHVDILAGATIRYSAASQPIDGAYPNWRQVIPKPEQLGPTVLGFNPKYVGDFASISDGVVFHTCRADDTNTMVGPTIVRCKAVPEFFGLLMPMCWQQIEPFPAWLMPPPTANARAIRALISKKAKAKTTLDRLKGK